MSVYTPDFFVGRSETVSASAAVVAPIVLALHATESILDIGCGQGEWLDAFLACRDHDWPLEVVGVDIAAPDGEHYLRHDLTKPLYLGVAPDWDARRFDLVVSLEVGEHLPEEAADTYVDTIVRHGGDILFSAAVPGQEGKGHINCQPHEYWHDKFTARGYQVVDSIRPRIAYNSQVSPWYRDNIFMYLRDR